MLFNQNIIDTIENCVQWSDRLTRADLINGDIATENDYTSNFTGALRREINSRDIPSLRARSIVLKPTIERAVGSDAAIILANLDTKEFKACLFEAKWPRLSTHKNCWDSLQKSSGTSHFDSQISRQSLVSGVFAIWEMFYSEHPYSSQPSYMKDFGSSCVMHDDALKASQARNSNNPWDDSELSGLLTAGSLTPEEIVRDVCHCKRGTLLSHMDYEQEFENYGFPDEILLIEFGGISSQENIVRN